MNYVSIDFPTMLSRRCHNSHHPLHIAYYFAQEHDDYYGELGLQRGPMAYLAGRAAPLGVVSPGTVVATFYNFNPELVDVHLPRIWAVASPSMLLRTRFRIVDAYLKRLLGPEIIESPMMAEAAKLATAACEGCSTPGRALYAANADLTPPDAPHLAYWHAITQLREHRGDGHLMALAGAGLDGLEALVTHSATGTGFTPSYLQAARGWSARQWASAQERLRERGLMDGVGELTERGMQMRRDIEAETDRLDVAPYAHLGTEGTKRLSELAAGFTKTIVRQDGLPLKLMGKR
ncbi:hypothetical protein [Nocardia sp. NPDC051570]|uniref:SCO6745 family protein n=1 Tax=Nocardia sp. NPDC051570 TaxID=3364324 RepID=UPI00379DAE1C